MEYGPLGNVAWSVQRNYELKKAKREEEQKEEERKQEQKEEKCKFCRNNSK